MKGVEQSNNRNQAKEVFYLFVFNVVIVGANGKLGKAAEAAIRKDPELNLIGRVVGNSEGGNIHKPLTNQEIITTHTLEECIEDIRELGLRPTVVLFVANANAGTEAINLALKSGIYCVVGTTGLFKDRDEWEAFFQKVKGTGKLLYAPNFAIGAIDMMRTAGQIAKNYSDVTVIERHHKGKADAPSGTAKVTAELIARDLQPDLTEDFGGSMGAVISGIRVHSIRTTGVVAEQEVCFGAEGQTLRIVHTTTDRSCFGPGIVMAIKGIADSKAFVYGLEELIYPKPVSP